MKTITFICASLIIIPTLLINSCTKNNSTNPSPSGLLVKTINSVAVSPDGSQHDSIFTTYTYDAQNRCTSTIAYGNSNGSIYNDTTLYIYDQSSIVAKYNNWWVGSVHNYLVYTYYLNPSGTLVDSSTLSGITSFPKTYYTYDENGYLIKQYISTTGTARNLGYTVLLDTSATYFSIAGGNTIGATENIYQLYPTSHTTVNKMSFTFSMPISSKTNIINGFLNSNPVFGHANIDFISSETINGIVTTDQYSFDNQNRLSTLITSNSSFITTNTYSY